VQDQVADPKLKDTTGASGVGRLGNLRRPDGMLQTARVGLRSACIFWTWGRPQLSVRRKNERYISLESIGRPAPSQCVVAPDIGGTSRHSRCDCQRFLPGRSARRCNI